MTIKEELVHVMERIAATTPSRTATAILLCEGEPDQPSLYGSKNRKAAITVLSASATESSITNILTHAFNETQTPTH